MGLQTENPKSWSVSKYIVAVLWMEGRLGPGDIAKQVKWTTGQVRGFYDREFKPARAHMTRPERQAILDFLKGWNVWFDVFVDARFEDRFYAKELRGERMARLQLEDAARPKEDREPSKKELRQIAADQAAQKRREEEERLKREFGYAPRGFDVDAVGWLYTNALGDKSESLAKGAMMSRDRRREALLKFRAHLAGRSISPLQAQDYEAVGGGGPKLALPEYRKFCIDTIGGVRQLLPAPMFMMLEAIVEQDVFIWQRSPKGAARAVTYDSIRYAADTLAVYYQMMTRDDFAARWGEHLPYPTRPVEAPDGTVSWVSVDQPSRSAARADSQATQNIVDQLTKAVA